MKDLNVNLSYHFFNNDKKFVVRFNNVEVEHSEKNEKLLLDMLEKVLPGILKIVMKNKLVPAVKKVNFELAYSFSPETPHISFGYENLPWDIPFKSKVMGVMFNAFFTLFFSWLTFVKTGVIPEINHDFVDENFWQQFEK